MATPVATVRVALPGDAAKLAPHLREADRNEIAAATGESTLEVLKRGIAQSCQCQAMVDEEDRPLALFGVDIGGVVWLLGSTRMRGYSLAFLRHSHHWVERLQAEHVVLWNFVDARNTLHIKWLEWCGFELRGETTDWGVSGLRFFRYERTHR